MPRSISERLIRDPSVPKNTLPQDDMVMRLAYPLLECFLSLKPHSFVHGYRGTHGKDNFLKLLSVNISEIRGVRV